MNPNVEQLIFDAHANAVSKGFWESENVAEHFALVATEVFEYEQAGGDKRLEELADVVIRLFDLCGWLGISLPDDVFEVQQPDLIGFVAGERFSLKSYRLLAHMTQAHRKREDDKLRILMWQTVRAAVIHAACVLGEDKFLVGAVIYKMEKNRDRPYKHGARY